MDNQNSKVRPNQHFAAAALLVICPVLAGADEVNVEDYLACNEIAEDRMRLDCYDKISRSITSDAAELVSHEPDRQPDINDGPDYVPLTDNVGLPSHRRQDASEGPEIRARVVRCRLGGTGKYIFYFENGQVWQQTGTTRQEFEECDFSVTIARDAFGYRMLPDGQSRKIRITRLK